MASTRALAHAPWSASKVQMALRCPREFYYRYVERQPEPEVMPETRIGKAIHATLEHALAGEPVEEAAGRGRAMLVGEVERVRFDALKENVPPFLARIDRFRHRRRVHRALIEYQLAVRENFTSAQFFSADAFYRGVCDAAFIYDDDSIAVVDHKSGARYPNMSITDQLQGYAVLAAAQFRNVRRFWLGIHWVADAEVEWAHAIDRSDINQYLLPKVRDNIEAAALAVDDGPRPTPTDWCLRCSYRSICPAGRSARLEPVEPIEADEDEDDPAAL